MKKIASILAALCAATAFCGFCTACSKQGVSNGGTTPDPDKPNNGVVTPDPDNTTNKPNDENGIVGDKAVVILLPGDNYKGNTKVVNKVSGDGITALTDAEADKYCVENAYFCTLAANTVLPTPTSERTDIEFVRWRYAVDGEEVAVDSVPEEVTSDIILIADWKKK